MKDKVYVGSDTRTDRCLASPARDPPISTFAVQDLLEASEADREISERVTAFVKTLRNRQGSQSLVSCARNRGSTVVAN